MMTRPINSNKPARIRSAALRHMSGHDTALHAAMRRLEPLPTFPARGAAKSHFHSLSRTILSQQLAGSAARTIHDRLQRLVERAFSDTEHLSQTEERADQAIGFPEPRKRRYENWPYSSNRDNCRSED